MYLWIAYPMEIRFSKKKLTNGSIILGSPREDQ